MIKTFQFLFQFQTQGVSFLLRRNHKQPHHNAGSSYQQKLLSHMGQLLRNRLFQLVTDNNCINGIQASNRKHGAGLELGMVAKENAL